MDRLLAELDAGRLELRFNTIGLNTPGRPTYSSLDNNLVSFVPLLIAVFFGLVFGWLIGLSVAAAGILFSITLGRRWVFSRAQARAFALLRNDETAMLSFWEDRLFALRAVASGAECLPPDGDWRAFIREQSVTRG